MGVAMPEAPLTFVFDIVTFHVAVQCPQGCLGLVVIPVSHVIPCVVLDGGVSHVGNRYSQGLSGRKTRKIRKIPVNTHSE
jgi:hypothetical protein